MSDIAVQYEDSMGDDLAVVNSAKVSFGKRSEWEPPETGCWRCSPDQLSGPWLHGKRLGRYLS